ncbi:hypothetical protein P389DRAFT_192046 [Cystobasidium minutum MCA 4210]|uniref:uncharacterized protein n=1 Tax=Cystobasidium minutum MCA 4210 TaxID=1397322 RepID=UPI0034CF2A17|eukprot:jgi/Rhomi1/192046/gm1.260_g
MANTDVLPGPLYNFFVYVEPLATIAGSVYAWTMPELYYRNLLPSSSLLERLTHAGPPQAGVMAIRQLGNCYIILACMSYFVLPKIVQLGAKDLRSTTHLLRTFFAILAFADITHIVATLVDLGEARWHPATWNMLAHGNTTLVVVLFAFRMWYFAYSSRLLRATKTLKGR